MHSLVTLPFKVNKTMNKQIGISKKQHFIVQTTTCKFFLTNGYLLRDISLARALFKASFILSSLA